jgi:hypothetical protein
MTTFTIAGYPEDDENLKKELTVRLNHKFVGQPNTPESRTAVQQEVENFLKNNYEKWKKHLK